MIQLLAFYLFATLVVVSGLLTISARNPVHSVLWLILAFFNAAGLMLLVGAEFIAMLLVIVYVGAVAVLFLFVVMMLDVDFAELRQGFLGYLPVGGLIGLIFLVELLLVVSTHLNDIVGQVFALFVLTVAAAEAAIGLAILVVFYRNRGSIAVEDVNMMRG